MRIIVALALLLGATPLAAQRVVRGLALDSLTGAPLRCVDVTLQDTTGKVVARTLTAADGSFRLESPPGRHELEFVVWGRAPAKRTILSPDSATGRPRYYPLVFDIELPQGLTWPDTADSPPGRPLNRARFGSFGNLARQGVFALTVARFAVEASGRVDRSSIQVLESTNKTWEGAVMGFLKEVQYEPARRNGRPVCALVYGIPFNFNAHP
jgi:hypothetical protein